MAHSHHSDTVIIAVSLHCPGVAGSGRGGGQGFTRMLTVCPAYSQKNQIVSVDVKERSFLENI